MSILKCKICLSRQYYDFCVWSATLIILALRM